MATTGCGDGFTAGDDGVAGGAGVTIGLDALSEGLPNRLFGTGEAGVVGVLPFQLNEPKLKPVPAGVGVVCAVAGVP